MSKPGRIEIAVIRICFLLPASDFPPDVLARVVFLGLVFKIKIGLIRFPFP